MKRKPVFIIFIMLIIIGLIIAWPTLRIVNSINLGKAEITSSFTTIHNIAKGILFNATDINNSQWLVKSENYWQTEKRLLSLIIKDTDDKIIYAKPKSSPYYVKTPKGISFDSKLGATMQSIGTIGGNLTIEALYIVITQEEIFYPLRDAAILLAALLLIMIAFLLLAYNANTPEQAKMPKPCTEASPKQELKPENTHAANENVQAKADIQVMSQNDADDTISSETVNQTEKPSETITSNSDDKPRGLYDTETGLGWEDYLPERLSAELRRSASFEQDLSLLVIVYDGVLKTDDFFKAFTNFVGEFFTFRDMAFNFSDTGVALILPNIDIDHGIRMGEEFHKKVYIELRKKFNDVKGRIYSGLSSRAGRLVDAERVILEAQTALSKAITDGSISIMAFRPNADKFRAYLAGQ